MPVRRAAALAAALSLAQPAAPAAEEAPLRPALSATIGFRGHDGAALGEIAPGQPFLIEVGLVNEAGTEPPRALDVYGWLRRASPQNLPCLQAARGFFGTGRLPMDAVPLVGPVVGVAAEDGGFTVVDPFLDLASANLIGAATLPERPAAVVAHPAGAGFLLSLPEQGEVRRITAFGATAAALATGLDRPTSLVADAAGGVWVLEAGAGRVTRFGADGGATDRRPGIALSGDATHVLVRGPGGELALLPGAGGAPILVLPAARGVTAEALVPGPDGPVAVLRLAGEVLAAHYLDAPDRPQPVALAAPAERLAVDPQGRFAVAWHEAGGPVSVVDLARGHVAQVIGARGADAAIAEVLLTDTALFLLRADQTMVGAVELAAIDVEAAAPVRRIPLGQPGAAPAGAAGFLARLLPRGEVLAVHAASQTGFLLHGASALGDAPPMDAVRLRGGIPAALAVLDRGFGEIAPGRLRAGAILPVPGPFELVLSTGVGGLTLCFPVPTAPVAAGVAGPGRMLAEIGGAGGDGLRRVTLRFADATGAAVSDISGTLSLSALGTGWTHRVPVAGGAEEGGGVALGLPPLGAFVATLVTLDGREFPPLVFEVNP